MRLDVLCSRNTCTVGSHSRHVRPIALFARSALPSIIRLQQARSTTRDHQQQQQQLHEQWQMPLLCSVALLILHATCAGSALCQNSSDSMNDFPSELSSPGDSTSRQSLGKLMGDKEVQGCARKCVATCIRGGGGAPGLGPLSQRRDIIVFKKGYRSRQYCLSECVQVCAAALNVKK